MVESKLAKLTNQSFVEAGGKEVFPDLEMDAPVFGYGVGYEERALENANIKLREAAEHHGDTHVFGIHYEVSGDINDEWFECKAIGTGYKPKE
jgi:hypothetical protein